MNLVPDIRLSNRNTDVEQTLSLLRGVQKTLKSQGFKVIDVASTSINGRIRVELEQVSNMDSKTVKMLSEQFGLILSGFDSNTKWIFFDLEFYR